MIFMCSPFDHLSIMCCVCVCVCVCGCVGRVLLNFVHANPASQESSVVQNVEMVGNDNTDLIMVVSSD